MNPISKAVQEVKYRIPRQVLEAVFVDGSRHFLPSLAASMENQIENLVIRPRVLVDCNLIGGQEITVALEGLAFEHPYNYTTVIRIPKSRTQERRINSVRNVSFFNTAALGGPYAGAAAMTSNVMGSALSDNGAVVSSAASLMASFDKIPQTSTSRVRLIAENTILIDDGIIIPTNSWLRCVLEMDENLSSLPLRSYRAFSTLVEHAVKAYIYNEMVVTIDQSRLHYGQELGRFKDIIDSYADANQNYQDFLRDRMEAIFLMSDEASYTRFIKMVVGGQR